MLGAVWLTLVWHFLIVAVVVKKPPYGSEQHLSWAPLPSNGSERNTRYVSNGLNSTQYSDWSTARSTSERYMHRSLITGVLDRPSHGHSVSQTHAVSGSTYGAPPQSEYGSSNSWHPAGTAGRSTYSRPVSSIGIGVPQPVAAATLPRSRTLETHLSSSSLGTSSRAYHRPLPPDPTSVRSAGRRVIPHTAHRM